MLGPSHHLRQHQAAVPPRSRTRNIIKGCLCVLYPAKWDVYNICGRYFSDRSWPHSRHHFYLSAISMCVHTTAPLWSGELLPACRHADHSFEVLERCLTVSNCSTFFHSSTFCSIKLFLLYKWSKYKVFLNKIKFPSTPAGVSGAG